MLKGRGRDPRVAPHPAPAHLAVRAPAQARQPAHSPTHLSIRTPTLPRAPLAKPEPDYEVVEFPTDQYVNAKLQPPPPPPPRPPTGHPAEAASCGLCGGGGARVRCTECGRRALCASCDDMYHRHPKRRHHQRQALSLNQIRDERPPLPPKGTPPVPPPRRHKMSGDRMSASPRPPSAADQRNSSLASHPTMHTQTMPNSRMGQNFQQIPAHLQKLTQAVPGGHLSSMPYLPTSAHHAAMAAPTQVNTMGHMSSGWQRPRNSLPGFNMPSNVQMAPEAWEAPENMVSQSWGRPLRRGASVLELGMSGVGGVSVGVGAACAGCGQCAGGWRYGSCASLDHQPWPAPAWPPPPCCHPPHPHAHAHPAAHVHAPYTPQPYRRADSRAASRVASRAGSRAASPAVSVRSRASRRTKHRTPSPPPLPSSDADSESESESDHPPPKEKPLSLPLANANKPKATEEWVEPPPAPAPAAARGPWQCEHCTFVNEAGVRVCAVCCRTPTAAPRELPADHAPDVGSGADRPSVAESVRSVAESARGIERLDLSDAASPPPPAQAQPRPRQNGETTKATTKKERVSTSCGPSPPREENVRKQNNHLVAPTREQSMESTRTRHDMAVGASPPREVQKTTSVARSPPRQTLARASPYREPEKPARHSISVGPSPPHENSIRPSTVQKKSAGTSPPREREIESRSSSSMIRTNVSNTGTSPPPQSISTQTYEVPNTWERAPSAARTRARRRLRDDSRRERSHSRHSLSSDTRESERSARTSGGGGGGGGRWEWREGRDSSPGGEWSGSERRPPPRLARRASHLDLRRERQPPARRSSFYRSEAASPEPTRAMSLEALATATGANAAAASRGLELARLMAEAERLGFSAAEVQAALAQSPAAPLSWLRSRWPSLCAGVRAAAARLAPHARVSELEARAALARHRGAMWPAVTDCVERHRRQAEKESGTRQHGGRVWGSPAGADDDAAPPRGLRAEDSSDEFEAPPQADLRDDDWMYLPLDGPGSRRESVPVDDWDERPADLGYREVASDVALELSRLLVQAGVPATNDDLILNSLLSNAPMFPTEELGNVGSKPNSIDFIQSENDFINAYNALTRSTPLPVVDDQLKGTQPLSDKDPKRDMYDVSENYSHSNIEIATANASNNKLIIHTPELLMDSTNKQTNVSQDNQLKARSINNSPPKQEEALILSTKVKYMPVREEITNVTIQHSNTEIIPKVDHLTSNNIQQPLIDNFEEFLPNQSTMRAQVEQNLNPIVENIPEIEQNINQAGFEKTNLNDIVGNTQKLIQQMRDEINSDINYIDSKNASQSELESSSNESDISSEHESSYSDTEDKETDELSSNESETSDTNSEKEHSNKRRPTIIHRTSSEENDQFEEAMDHIEDQIEDFKNTNIEILDSIARSLQEEHSISVQVNEPRSIINDKRQDLNNNMFVEVNSFEEIYAQLNTNKNEASNQERVKNHNSTIGSPNKTDMNVTRQQDTVGTFNSNSQIQETISKDSHNILYNTNVNRQGDLVHSSEQNVPEEMETDSSKNSANAQNNLDANDVVSNSSDEEHSLDSADSNITTTEQDNPLNNITASLTGSINIQHIEQQNSAVEDSTSEYIIIEDPIEKSTILESTEENMVADNATQIILTDDRFDPDIATENNIEQKIITVSRSQADLTEETVAMETTPNISIENSDEHDNTVENIVEERNLSEERAPERTTTEIVIDQTATASNITEQTVNSNEQKVLTEDIVEQNIVSENTTAQRTVADNNQESIDINNTDATVIHLKENEAVINATEERKRSPTKSPPNSPTDAGTNKAFTVNKSNIPKLVKVVQNNKQKGDKTSPKVIASKVPVRRASLKQYPAPTPPKTHFGNVQSGHVKQLQTRLFNNKFPKTVVNVPDVIDVKPSTSTIHKKKPAPPPPTTNAAQKQPVLEKPSPPKEKKNSFFRESCRTEDEWTESETEDAPLPAPRESEEPQRPLSPPPPVTVRRVSGQIIDLARVRLPEGSPERQARMLLAEGATETWEQARLAVELVSRGAEPPAALLAALECADLPAALAYLHQDCELCASRLPEHEMVSMLRCTHRCCRECARLYFTVQITERSIADCVCPYCKEPDLENTPEDAWLEYFAHLDILLKTLLETDVHELFQRKLRDRTLALDPNFRWCMECSSGFFVHPKQKKIRCPECRSVSCAKCRKTWSANHEGLSCEQYAAWLDDNDPERSLAAVQQHLRDNGLECPRCRFKYSLSRGGCMHFTCTQCKYEFCYGCGKPFMMGARCGLSEYCGRLGLHAHHPRNCLFYLRDKEPHELQTLLQMNNVEYETATPEGSGNRCPIQLQRETPTGLVDGTCGSEAPPNYAGLCKNHYLEYLSRAVRREGVDPLPLLDVDDLETLVKRAALRPPPRPYGTLEGLYKRALLTIVKEKIPLD